MTTVLVTGAAGFIGKHLVEALKGKPEVRVLEYDVGNTAEELNRALLDADIIYHLAGVNRPQDPKEYETGNADFTKALCSSLENLGRKPTIVLSSSIQAELDNPYGSSKRRAEKTVEEYARKGAEARGCGTEDLVDETTEQKTEGRKVIRQRPKGVIFRLKNVFGKWCRPNYNSVVATFCHNIAHDLPISISDSNRVLQLLYIDDVIAAFLGVLDQKAGDEGGNEGSRKQKAKSRDKEEAGRKVGMLKSDDEETGSESLEAFCYRKVGPSFEVTLGDLAAKIRSFRESRKSLVIPSLADDFTRCLYATYLSYMEGADFAYSLETKTDNRGCLAEFMKSEHFGQVFVSRTRPGITRGNHYHHTKTEKFLVVEGEAVIRLRPIQRSGMSGQQSEIIEHRVSGRDFRVVDIPPGYTHSIENLGDTELVVLFWASEIFDPAKPDTIGAPVLEK